MFRGATILCAVGTVLVACAESGDPARPGAGSSTRVSAAADANAPLSPTGASERLVITAGGVELVATLRDTTAARDLLSQLPLRIEMSDHGGVEKTGRLPRPLTTSDEPSGADPEVADLGYYAPGNDLVLYYGDQSYYEGIVILGRLDGDLAELARTPGPIDVTVQR
ncbi:cyclophilin-like fold protein [Williamsia sp. M5A3_1d]